MLAKTKIIMISVIIPVYNVEKYLSACIESVLGQTYTDYEIILIDDGSTDGSPEICDCYAAADVRIKTVHQTNRGLSCARNAGLEHATGDFITFIDSDDIVSKFYLEYLWESYHITKADIIQVKKQLFYSDSEIKFHASVKPNLRTFDSFTAVIKSFYQTSSIEHSVCGTLYQRKVLENVKFTAGILYEDLDFFYRSIPVESKFAISDDSLYYYRQNRKSILHTFNSRRTDVLRVTQKAIDYFTLKYPDRPELIRAANDRQLSAAMNIFALCRVYGEPSPGLADKCWQLIRKHRKASLFDTNVRLKNKLGILLSYFGGKPLFSFAAKILTK